LENIRDAIAKGRFRRIPVASKRQPTYRERARGSRQGLAKLDECAVRDIRTSFKGGVSQDALATQYGVHQGTISAVVRGKTWRHITG
jgi:hypothetical protein